MTKILHISTDKNIGGAGHQILGLIGASDKSAYAMEVVVPEGSRLVPLLVEQGTIYHEAPHIAAKSFSLAGIRTLYALIKKLRPDIVHTHSSLSGRIAARLNRRPRVVHTRHSAFPIAGWRKRFPIKQVSGLMNNALSDRIIAISPAAEENLLDLGTAPGKIRMMFNGTPPVRDFSQEEIVKLKVKYGIPQDVFVLAKIARLTEVKGHDDILDAAKAVPDVLILFAGDGERKAHLEDRIRRESIENVKLFGFIDEVDEIFALMDVQINASFGTDTSSLVLIKGMSIGRPAIATNYGGNPYLIRDGVNGLLVPTHDGKAIAEAIKRLKSDRALYESMAENARPIFKEEFTDKKMAENTEAVYREL